MKKLVLQAIVLKIVFIFALLLISLPAAAAEAVLTEDQSIAKEKIINLESLHQSINQVDKNMAALQRELKSQAGVGREDELRNRIIELSRKKAGLRRTFTQTVTEVDLDLAKDAETSSLNWNAELTELLGPIISELKKVTSRPRELERLRSRIEILGARLPQLEKAVQNINELLTQTESPSLVFELIRLKESWIAKREETLTQKNIYQRQLDQELGKKKPLSQSLKEIMQLSFKSRGRNLILAFLTLFLGWLFLHWLHKAIRKVSPFHKAGRSIPVRVFDLMFIVVSVIFSFTAFLSVLYLFGDWVLLSLALIFVVGLAWASKQALPRFWNQARLILNFGPVREDEKLIYKGLPYMVKSVNLFSELVNEELTGGRIRLPISDLLDLRSRPYDPLEPWFPSRQGDWVVLDDETFGKVLIQTPEVVKLDVFEGGTVSVPSIEYLNKAPVNLSNGYELTVSFGVDYRHIQMITRDIPALFDQALSDRLADEGYADVVGSHEVQFDGPQESSLNVIIKVYVIPGQGQEYILLGRAIKRICVETCNNEGLTIPFQQIMVHMSQS